MRAIGNSSAVTFLLTRRQRPPATVITPVRHEFACVLLLHRLFRRQSGGSSQVHAITKQHVQDGIRNAGARDGGCA